MGIVEFTFFQQALLILVLISIIAGIAGTLIVIKKISMMSGSIAHGAFGGLGIAYFLGLQPILGALIFSLLGALAISYTYQKYKNYLDSILTIFWAGGMAIGIIFVFLTPGYAVDLFSYLFGNVLLSSKIDIYTLAIISLVVIFSVVVFYETLIAVLFNEEFAKLKGINVTAVFTIFLVIISLSIVAIIKGAGIILTLAMLTIAPTISIKYFKKVKQIMLASVIINIVTSLSGLFIAYYVDLPTAPTIILIQIGLFILSFGSNALFNKHFRRS